MENKSSFLAIDLGATSGRAILGTLENGVVELQELTRFDNTIIEVSGHYYWDIFALYNEIIKSLRFISKQGIYIQSIGIDTWGCDFVCFGDDGGILRNPLSYRDPHTAGAMERYFAEKIGKEEVYNATGIQLMNFNSLFQLYTMRRNNDAALRNSDKILFIPDALSYLLTGVSVCEYTVASTSQLLNPVLAELDAVARGAYVRQTAAELFLDEGVVADALRKFLQRGGAEPAAPADLQRPVLRQADDAVRRAGRELLAAAWHTPDLLTEILSFIPRTDFPDELIGGILGAMAEHLQAGGALDADFIAAQPTAARDELMRTLAEEGRTDASYRGALATLRRAYLTAALARHTRRAEAMMQEGKAAYIDELNEVKKIQDEISRENLNE